MSQSIQTFLLVAPILLFSMVAHEYAHGYAALKQGDPTAYMLGRLTFNPLKHIDPWMTVLLPVLLWFGSGGQVVFGPNPRGFGALPVDPSDQFHLLGVAVSYVDVICIGISVLLMMMLQRIIFHSRMGTAMRAVSWNPSVAALMGVNIDRVISFTFVLGSILAAVAGILYATAYRKVDPLMGLMPGLKAFVAAVLGGIGNVQGAMLGGLILGLAEQLVSSYVSSSWKDAIAFSILILILLVKPSGLLGKGAAEKV